jgi:hypothetical protein
MICCGPLRLERRVLKPETIVAGFAPDGGMIDPSRQSGSAR